MGRLAFAAVLLVVTGILVLIAYQLQSGTRAYDLILNLAIEVFGILITLAVVDWMLEWRRRQERARNLAWAILHSVERACWVWQGGPRRLDSDELLGLIKGIDSDDEMKPFTRSLLVGVGSRAREALNREAPSIRTLSGLEAALKEFTSLNSLAERQSSVSIRLVAEVLEFGVLGLARILGLPSQPMPSSFVRGRDASREAQQQRYYDLRAAAAPEQGAEVEDLEPS
ncbi:MAG: hypothetical protein GWN32_00935 [Gemmatimonadetes bacterium]|nr:hypothetical protein [Gemmatimonadota bacterium]